MRVLADRILVRIKTVEDSSPSGLYIPGAASFGDAVEAEIVAVGDEVPVYLKCGHRILINPNTRFTIIIDGQELRVIHEEDAILILSETEGASK